MRRGIEDQWGEVDFCQVCLSDFGMFVVDCVGGATHEELLGVRAHAGSRVCQRGDRHDHQFLILTRIEKSSDFQHRRSQLRLERDSG